MMGSQTVRPVFVVREGEGVCHIVGQFAQRIVVPQIPAVFLFQPLQPGQNIGTGIGKVVSAQQSGTDGPFQIGKGVAVRLEGTQQECKFMASGLKSLYIGKQGGSQELMTAFLHRKLSPLWLE